VNRGLRLFALPLAGLILAPAALAATPPAGTSGPPATPTDDVTTTYWGVKVADPYRWLENADSPKVMAWIKAQNTWTEHVLGSYTQGETIAKRVEQLSLTSTQRSDPSLVAGKLN
jgi:prolyl oligopeptidase